MITVIVADDEAHARKRLCALLGRYPEITIAGEVSDGDSLLDCLTAGNVDVAFLDINMPGASVFSTLSSLPDPPLIVFQTAYADYAQDAFEVEAVDYLMKPVGRERLDKCVSKIKKALSHRNPERISYPERISVKYGSIMKVIEVNGIFAVRSEEGFSFIYTQEGRFISDRSLHFFEGMLPGTRFYRISRTAIVNTDYVKVLHPMFKGSYSLELKNGLTMNVSRRRMKRLKELLQFL
ncbi:MAG: response regulator transcription factor [Spirochaetales bacterium]|nr:response regulator transcription factor [Spirochaetales bacterium]